MLDQTCTPELILRGTHEVLARELHEAYLEGVEEQIIKNKSAIAIETWDDLPEDTKEKNRKQADRIAIILDNHNYRIAPLTDWRMADKIFTKKESVGKIESMACMEHELWCKEMLGDGWRYGTIKSKKHKTNPALVTWKTLQEDPSNKSEEINKTIKYILDLPKVLARAGFQIEKIIR